MAMIHLTVVTPEGKPYDDEAQKVIVRTTGGDVCILPQHIDYSAAIGQGEMRITKPDGNVLRAQVKGGMLHVASNVVQVITHHVAWTDQN